MAVVSSASAKPARRALKRLASEGFTKVPRSLPAILADALPASIRDDRRCPAALSRRYGATPGARPMRIAAAAAALAYWARSGRSGFNSRAPADRLAAWLFTSVCDGAAAARRVA